MYIYENGKVTTREPDEIYIDFKPTAKIISPENGSNFLAGENIVFRGMGTDPKEGELDNSLFSWTSNLHYGSIGVGKEFSTKNLLAGTHNITLRVKDSDEVFVGKDTIEISVAACVSIGNISAPPSGKITESIMANNVTYLVQGTAFLKYNNSVVHVTDVSSGNENALTLYDSSIYNADGLVMFQSRSLMEKSGDVILANITFKAVGNEGSSSPLVIDFIYLNNLSPGGDEIPHIRKNGSFTVLNK